jgi:23S rRNA pseudouridine1911/1915/1917 synthase
MNQPEQLLNTRIPLEFAGRRFDASLAELFPDYSRSRLAAWIKDGAARLDGETVAPRHTVRGGEQVEILVRMQREVNADPQAIPLDIRHEDDDIIVVNKPPGLIAHPGAGNPDGTLQNALLHHDPRLAEIPRAGLVHRLDKETSGLMVVARTLRAHTSLVEQIARRSMHRQYEAVDRLRQAVREDGREAVTHYRVREKFRAMTLLECRLETGRTHQIRVHMAHVRHPIVGDLSYGNLRLPKGATSELIEALRGFRRQALHAERGPCEAAPDAPGLRACARPQAQAQSQRLRGGPHHPHQPERKAGKALAVQAVGVDASSHQAQCPCGVAQDQQAHEPARA